MGARLSQRSSRCPPCVKNRGLVFATLDHRTQALARLVTSVVPGKAVRRCAGNDGDIASLCGGHNGPYYTLVQVLLSVKLYRLRQFLPYSLSFSLLCSLNLLSEQRFG